MESRPRRLEWTRWLTRIDPAFEHDQAPARPWLEWVYALGPVVALTLLGLLTMDRPSLRGLEPTVVLVVIPLAARRMWPIPMLIVVSAGALLTSTESPAPWIEVCAVGLASFTVGERSADRLRSGLVAIGLAALLAGGFLAQGAQQIREARPAVRRPRPDLAAWAT